MEDLIGKTFARLTVLSIEGAGNKRFGECRCECGNVKRIRVDHVKNGSIRSCGCLRREISQAKLTTHGKYGSRLYDIWGNLADDAVPEWKTFEGFSTDVPAILPGLKFHRPDKSRPWGPANSVWVTKYAIAKERSDCWLIEWNGKQQTLGEWSIDTGLKKGTIRRRLLLGWNVQEALTEPAFIGRNGSWSADYFTGKSQQKRPLKGSKDGPHGKRRKKKPK